MSEVFSDDKRSLAEYGSNTVVTLKNIVTGCQEKFKIDGEKGRGGSCIVYEAVILREEQELDRKVLLKEFYPFRSCCSLKRENGTLALKLQSPAELDKFEREKRSFLEVCKKQLKFYNDCAKDIADELVEIQEIYNFGDTTLVMMPAASGRSWDMVEDENLYQVLETALSLVRQLKLYHDNNLLHCDIKPENIYIFPRTRQQVILLDFGSVVSLEDGALTGGESLSYSAGFAAPEVLKAVKADNYSQ